MLMNTLLAISTLVLGILGIWVYEHYFRVIPWHVLAPQKNHIETIQLLPGNDPDKLLIAHVNGMTRHQWRNIQKRVMAEVDKQIGTVNGRGPALFS